MLTLSLLCDVNMSNHLREALHWCVTTLSMVAVSVSYLVWTQEDRQYTGLKKGLRILAYTPVWVASLAATPFAYIHCGQDCRALLRFTAPLYAWLAVYLVLKLIVRGIWNTVIVNLDRIERVRSSRRVRAEMLESCMRMSDLMPDTPLLPPLPMTPPPPPPSRDPSAAPFPAGRRSDWSIVRRARTRTMRTGYHRPWHVFCNVLPAIPEEGREEDIYEVIW